MASNLRILHLEDNPGDAELAVDVLARAGYICQVRLESSGPAFEAALRESGPWDLILIDFGIPGYDGMTAIETARRRFLDVPVIVLSGTVGEERAVDCMRAGATDLILKVNLERLGAAVARALRQVQERRVLEELRARAQVYLDMVAVMVVALDPSGVVTQVNRKGCEILGRTEAELLGVDWFDTCVPPSMGPQVREVFERIVSGELQGLEFYENPVLRADGTERQISWRNTIIRDEEGGFVLCLSSGLDVTDERRMQVEVRRNEARLRSLVDILQFEAATTQEFLDHALAEAIGLTESRLGYIYFYDEDRRLFELNTWSREVMAQCSVVEPKTVYELDKTGVWGDAVRTRRPVILNDFAAPHPGKRGQPEGHAPLSRFLTVPVICGGRIVAVVGVANKEAPYDDTDVLQLTLLMDSVWRVVEQRRVKEQHDLLQEQFLQSQKMEAVGRLAGGVAHDFNNMLQAIIGNADLALEAAGDSTDLREAVAEIHQAAGRAADLTRGLLAFARKQTVSPRSVDLGEVVTGTLKMLRRLIGEDIDLAWMPGHALWPVTVDPTQVDQILTNLVVNARDAIVGVGKITIETGNETVDEAYCRTNPGFVPGDYVTLTVTDDGCGMDWKTQVHLFEPFFTTKEVGKGTGLGLATVYGIAKQNGGFVNVYSEPGKGSSFRIYLPRTDGAASPASAKPDEAVVPGGSETILLVEDEPAILRLGRQVLGRRGYVVLVAGSPSEALNLVRAHQGPIHLMVTDVVMPEMNGRDLVAQVKELMPAIRCLYMSGYTANAIAHQGILDPDVEFLPKPFSASGLALRVRQVLDQD